MALVDLASLFTVEGGFSPTLRGTATASYVVGDRPSVELDGPDVRFSVPIRAVLTGEPVQVDMVPTRGVRCVKWTISDVEHSRTLIRHTEIPDVATVAFADLVDVDPYTFLPSDEGQAAWDAAVTAAQAALSGAVSAADAAATSAGAADESAQAALVAAGEAVPAAQEAVEARDASVTSAGDAETARDAAVAAAASVAPGVAGGTATLDGGARLPEAQVPERLSETALSVSFVASQQVDGSPLPAGSSVRVIVNANGDIDDIIFTEGA